MSNKLERLVVSGVFEDAHKTREPIPLSRQLAGDTGTHSRQVGDNGIKAGVWYSLNADGEFVEES
jgi:hypothetical protein